MMEWKHFAMVFVAMLMIAPAAFADSANQAPVITNVGGPTSLNAGQTGTWTVSAYDPDGTYLTYGVTWGDGLDQKQAGQTQSGSTATLQHTYQSAGTYTITFTVTDAAGASTQSTLTTVVASTTPANQPPVITSVSGPDSLSVNQMGRWDITAYDPDGTYLEYSVNFGDNPSLTPTYVGSVAGFQHAYAQAGTYTLTFRVSDSAGTKVQSTKTVVVGDSQTGLQVGRIWMEPDPLNAGSVVLLSKVTYNGQPASMQDTNVYFTLTDTRGITSTSKVGYNCQIQNYCQYNYYGMGMGIGTLMPCGTMTLAVKAERNGQTATGSESLVLSPPNCNQASSNLPPVITSVAGPAEIAKGAQGTWKVSAYDPDGTYLTYSVVWGDEGAKEGAFAKDTGSTAGFVHTFANSGTYTIKFTVTDSAGASTQSTLTVSVAGGTSGNGGVKASVGAVPTEVSQYDSVYVTGTVSRSADASGDSPQEYRVVLSLDNGNNVAGGVSQSGSVAQAKEETVTLAPGESRDVSAYFTASQLGTNFAKILVYQKSGSTQSGYILVASDSVKVSVTQGGSTPGIPAPPAEKMAISLKQGWNQVSVPTGYIVSLSDIQQKCGVTSAWYYDTALGQYEAATSFSGGTAGAWMKAGSDCTYELDAPYASTWSVPLKAGWNMIGAPAGGATLTSVAGDCSIASGAWNYAPSAGQYIYSSSLEPGKGYWVKVAGACTLQGTGDMPPAAPTETAQGTTAQATQPAQAIEPAQVTAPQAATAATHTKDPQATEPAQAVQATQPQAYVKD